VKVESLRIGTRPLFLVDHDAGTSAYDVTSILQPVLVASWSKSDGVTDAVAHIHRRLGSAHPQHTGAVPGGGGAMVTVAADHIILPGSGRSEQHHVAIEGATCALRAGAHLIAVAAGRLLHHDISEPRQPAILESPAYRSEATARSISKVPSSFGAPQALVWFSDGRGTVFDLATRTVVTEYHRRPWYERCARIGRLHARIEAPDDVLKFYLLRDTRYA
jgi:hypothetical protein